jgi:hypothetical protein
MAQLKSADSGQLTVESKTQIEFSLLTYELSTVNCQLSTV